MSIPPRRNATALLVALLAGVTSCGIGGDSRNIPPAPTAAPGSADVFIYVAEATAPQIGTSGGAVNLYQLGSDGLLPGGAPLVSIPAVNPRRLFKHPELDVMYVATVNQILAFDISGGGLVSLCGGSGPALAPPCATGPRLDADPIDMVVEPNPAEDGFVLYVVERGGGNQLSDIVAYPLDADGGLPLFPASLARSPVAFFYLGFAVAGDFGYAADPSRTGFDRFPILPDGNFTAPAPTPTMQGQPTPVNTPTPIGPTPIPTASPSFFFLDDIGPAKTIKVTVPQPNPADSLGLLYTLVQAGPRIGALPVDGVGNLPLQPTSQSRTRGIYNEFLVSFSVNRIYGAGFQIGQIDSFAIGPDGSIDPNSLSATFANTAQFPTGLAYVEHATSEGVLRRTMLVSLGGFDRVDAYEVAADGTLPALPFSSTEPRPGTFPSDVLTLVVE
jgi:hypothetical protein